MEDISLDAIADYRRTRSEVSPSAEELTYSDEDLLLALNCVKRVDGRLCPTVAGLLLFGTNLALRRLFPMVRVDYIRVPGRQWVEDPENRFVSVDMRGPLMQLVRRAEAAVIDDLPVAFALPEGQLQRTDELPIPQRALREAIVNAVMHRSYRKNSPVQIIRYANRIEIRNPGYSLKPHERFGEPGSESRNPSIAAVLHETRFAETKGSGIRVMRRLMQNAKLSMPTFESDRHKDEFTTRLLLHHFLSEADLRWLEHFVDSGLTQDEKTALVFVREVGAIDNAVYRDLNDMEALKASRHLRRLCDVGLLALKGKGNATYYVPTEKLQESLRLFEPNDSLETTPLDTSPTQDGSSESVPATPLSEQAENGKASHFSPKGGMEPSHFSRNSSMGPSHLSHNSGLPTSPEVQLPEPPDSIKAVLGGLKRHLDRATMSNLIRQLCSWRSQRLEELAIYLDRDAKYLARIVSAMVQSGELEYTIPDMPKHPRQAYKTPD